MTKREGVTNDKKKKVALKLITSGYTYKTGAIEYVDLSREQEQKIYELYEAFKEKMFAVVFKREKT